MKRILALSGVAQFGELSGKPEGGGFSPQSVHKSGLQVAGWVPGQDACEKATDGCFSLSH